MNVDNGYIQPFFFAEAITTRIYHKDTGTTSCAGMRLLIVKQWLLVIRWFWMDPLSLGRRQSIEQVTENLWLPHIKNSKKSWIPTFINDEMLKKEALVMAKQWEYWSPGGFRWNHQVWGKKWSRLNKFRRIYGLTHIKNSRKSLNLIFMSHDAEMPKKMEFSHGETMRVLVTRRFWMDPLSLGKNGFSRTNSKRSMGKHTQQHQNNPEFLLYDAETPKKWCQSWRSHGYWSL